MYSLSVDEALNLDGLGSDNEIEELGFGTNNTERCQEQGNQSVHAGEATEEESQDANDDDGTHEEILVTQWRFNEI